MNRSRFNIGFIEFFCKPVSTMLGAGKNQNLLPVFGFYQMAKQFGLVGFITEKSNLLDCFCGCVPGCHFDFYRINQ
jgi:hypothetical protein